MGVEGKLIHGQVLIWAGLALVSVVVLAQLVKYPGKILVWILKSAVLGCLFIFAANWVGQYFHFHLPFNAVTTMIAGFLGLPGLAALVTLKLWITAL
jgi:inhibitor of the pro-sigma K processing machinery